MAYDYGQYLDELYVWSHPVVLTWVACLEEILLTETKKRKSIIKTALNLSGTLILIIKLKKLNSTLLGESIQRVQNSDLT